MVKNNFGLEALGMIKEALHQLRPLNAVDVGRPVVDIGGGHELAALRNAGNQDRLEIGARRIHGCGVAGWARPENKNS